MALAGVPDSQECHLQNCTVLSQRRAKQFRPLPVRIAIRDSFEPPTAPVQKALAKLNSTVGYDFSIVVPWVDIHRDLASSFPDLSVLVPTISAALTTYINAIITLLDEQKFQDAFLEKMSAPAYRDIIVRIGEQINEDQTFFDKSGKLTLSLPQTGPDWYRRMSSRIGHDLGTVFLSSENSVQLELSHPQKVKSSDWVDIGLVPSQKASAIISLPSIRTLSKPETLFPTLLPYYLIVTSSGASIHVEGSHQPTLELVHSYFQMHTRKNMTLTTQVLTDCYLVILILGAVSQRGFETWVLGVTNV